MKNLLYVDFTKTHNKTLTSTLFAATPSKQAASLAQNPDADAMLVKNAQNLMDAVQRTVRACEAASIKVSDVMSAAVVSIQWKKKVRKLDVAAE